MVKGITYILAGNSTIRNLVGENAAEDKYKVYPNVCPNPEKYPYIVVRQSGKVPIECKDPVPNCFTYSYDVVSYHKNYEDAEALDAAVLAALAGVSGTQNGVDFEEIRFVTSADQYVSEYEGLHAKVSSFESMVNV
jgi:hypothetical protein